MIGNATKFEMGKVIFEMSKPRDAISPDEWAELCVSRIMMVSDTAPEPLRAQAYGFREQIRKVIAKTVKQAIETDRNARTRELIKDI